ncbi:MAG: ClpXP protease specificity-enhancing factor [Gammaproteobacteria bacterium]|nr:ClpXP protease specificity-enhancing factor [Gammaproteobacteria bacterium]MBQ0839721.1 ClpXP protease specificity-enhancing factor [Gammaproteobacteria bacterium]
MTSNKPYLVRAFFDWIVDNDCTPHVVVNALAPGVEVPQFHVNDGQIVLNIAPRAVSAFNLDNDGLWFTTRFGGVPTDIFAPMHAIMGIYARENGEGMGFESLPPEAGELSPVDDDGDDPNDKPPRGSGPGGSKRPTSGPSGVKPSGPKLRVVK